jgi:hypothetical protein
MHNIELQYIAVVNHYKNKLPMHDLYANFRKFSDLVKNVLTEDLDYEGNVKDYRHKPKQSDQEIIALSLTQEALSIDSENYFWIKLKSDYSKEFPNLIHITRYNLRKKSLKAYIDKYNRSLSDRMNEFEDSFIVDSMPVPICKICRENRVKVCKEDIVTSPDKGYSASIKQYYIGYKLHLVISIRGIFQSMELTKASVHDIHYLSDIKYSGLNNCTLLADKGYLSAEYQTDLFNYSRIKLETPKRSNQEGFELYPYVFKKCRKRVETLFSQLCDQFMLKRNYAKSFSGLSTRIISKLACVTSLQYFNYLNGLPLNHIKHALAA